MTAVPTRRLPDWPVRLAAFLESHEARPFGCGVHDCCMFLAGTAAAITGWEGLGFAWHDVESAAAILRHERGLAAAVTARLGPPLSTPALAQRGDALMVLAAGPKARARFLAVCDADRWVAPGVNGLLRGPMAQAHRAWPVGRVG